MLGTFVLSAEYHDSYFTKAQKIRRLIQQKTKEMFEKYDFISLFRYLNISDEEKIIF